MPQDKSLQMNQTIETAILQLQQSPTPEQLQNGSFDGLIHL